jgi:hypothetical protein
MKMRRREEEGGGRRRREEGGGGRKGGGWRVGGRKEGCWKIICELPVPMRSCWGLVKLVRKIGPKLFPTVMVCSN